MKMPLFATCKFIKIYRNHENCDNHVMVRALVLCNVNVNVNVDDTVKCPDTNVLVPDAKNKIRRYRQFCTGDGHVDVDVGMY